MRKHIVIKDKMGMKRRLHGQQEVVGEWAGAVMRVGRGSIWVGGDRNAQKSVFQPISCHPKFRVIELPSFGRAQPLIESLSQRLKMSAVWNYKKNKVTQVRVCGRAGQ